MTSISPDDVCRINIYVSTDMKEKYEEAMRGRRTTYWAVFDDKVFNYGLDLLELSGGVLPINELPSCKERKKPGPKKQRD